MWQRTPTRGHLSLTLPRQYIRNDPGLRILAKAHAGMPKLSKSPLQAALYLQFDRLSTFYRKIALSNMLAKYLAKAGLYLADEIF